MRILIGLMCLVPMLGFAAEETSRPVCAPDGIGVGGYDLLSYHEEGGPVRGQAGLAADYAGLSWQFVSAQHRDAFVADPEAYMPVYRGWCAATLAMGRLACPDYTNFKIEEGRLLLFELAGFTNGRTLWNTDPAGFRQRADDQFKRLLAAP